MNEISPSPASSLPRVVIVGAGPIGLELAAALIRHRISYAIFEAGPIGHTISWWPPQTRWFSSNERIAIAGVPLLTSDQSKATREQYLTYLRNVVSQLGIQVHTFHRVTDIRRTDAGFKVKIQAAGVSREVSCETVVLATGGLDHARRLKIPGEDLPHVDGYLREPHRYFGQEVLIIGGRNSAVEAALRLHHAGAEVTLSYRGAELPKDHIKYWLYPEIQGLIRSGRIRAFFKTRPLQITPTTVELQELDCQQDDKSAVTVRADAVLTLLGYVQDKTLYRKIGVELVGEEQRPGVNPETLETNVPGIYVAGTAIAGTQSSHYKIFLENCHQHVDQIVSNLTGKSTNSIQPAFQEQVREAPES
jgi:thioredoxin reductase (NADPH)